MWNDVKPHDRIRERNIKPSARCHFRHLSIYRLCNIEKYPNIGLLFLSRIA
jgi:hypothetical protein